MTDEELAAIKARYDDACGVHDGVAAVGAAAVNYAGDVPKLVSEVERLRADVERYRRNPPRAMDFTAREMAFHWRALCDEVEQLRNELAAGKQIVGEAITRGLLRPSTDPAV